MKHRKNTKLILIVIFSTVFIYPFFSFAQVAGAAKARPQFEEIFLSALTWGAIIWSCFSIFWFAMMIIKYLTAAGDESRVKEAKDEFVKFLTSIAIVIVLLLVVYYYPDFRKLFSVY